MDSQFLAYYNRELAYLKEMGKEFSEQYPKIAGRLGMHGIDVSDPYVERLLEGFSFLTARIHLKMDAEFPKFTQSLLDIIYPSYTAPLPSMAITQITPSMSHGNMNQGYEIERGNDLRPPSGRAEISQIVFSTAHTMELWPLEIKEVSLGPVPADIPVARLKMKGGQNSPKSALRINFKVRNGIKIDKTSFDKIMFYVHGQDVLAQQLLELILTNTVDIICHHDKRPLTWISRLGKENLRHEGFDNDQALLPTDHRVFQGYRVIQEYFAFPARFMFFSVKGLNEVVRKAAANHKGAESFDTFEMTFLFNRSIPDLEGVVNKDNLLLHCVPIVNLFEKYTDKVELKQYNHEFHIVADRTKPVDYEIYNVLQLKGSHDVFSHRNQEFRPFYRSQSYDKDKHSAYYIMRRASRVVSVEAKRNGTRTSYLGSEVYVSLVDQNQAPFDKELTHLSIRSICTNRDLPLLMTTGSNRDLIVRSAIPADGCKIILGPTKPRQAIAEVENVWRLINHLGLNYASLMDMDKEKGAEALRDMLNIYAHIGEPAIVKQISGIRSVQVEPMTNRLPVPGPIVYGRGAKITVEVDEHAFSGLSPFLFGAVLEHFFARHVSINMMTEFVLKSEQRGEIHRWKPRMGGRPVI